MFCDIFKNFSPVPIEFIVPSPNARNDESYGRRIVEHYELELIDSGIGKVVVNGVDIPTLAHSLHFRRPGMEVEGIGIYESHYIEFYFNESKDIIDELNAMPCFYQLEEHSEIQDIFRSIFSDHFIENSTSTLTFKIHVLRLFEFMVNDWYFHTQNPSFSATTAENIRHSMSFIQLHYASPLTVQQMAVQSGYSLYHYTRMFKEVTNLTPIQYLNRCRINHAKQMLVETQLSTEEILYACGFNNYSYFFRTFKEQCGVTPVQYKRKHKTQVNFK